MDDQETSSLGRRRKPEPQDVPTPIAAHLPLTATLKQHLGANSDEAEDMYKGSRVGVYGPKTKKGKGRPGDTEGHRKAALKGWAKRRAKGDAAKPAKERSPYGSRFSRGLPPIGTRESRGLPPRAKRTTPEAIAERKRAARLRSYQRHAAEYKAKRRKGSS